MLDARLGFAVRDGLRFCVTGTFADANPVRVSVPALGWPVRPAGRADVGIRIRVLNTSATNYLAQGDTALLADGTSAATVQINGGTMNATLNSTNAGELIAPGGEMFYSWAGPRTRDLWLVGTAGQTYQVSGNLIVGG